MSEINNNYVKEIHTDWEKARITQLLSYMSDCQQGMRDLNGQILTVLTVVSSLLSLLFGISIFRGDSEVAEQLIHLPINKGPFNGRLYEILNEVVLRRRLYYWFTTIIFIATVLYVIFLAIEAILRYHYSQHLADRLHTLIPGTADDIDRNALLTFEQFGAPIRTLNYLHLCTSHSMFNYFASYISGILAVMFCLGILITQYLLIAKKEWYDHFLLVGTIMVLGISIILFVRFYACADHISDKAFEIGHENLEVRKGIVDSNVELYRGSEEFRSFFHYLIMPRTESLYKVIIVVYGFIVASVFSCEFYPTHLIYIVIVYELLLYQARYQFNDIRGIGEDNINSDARKRLGDYLTKNKSFRITISIIMVVIRIACATMIIISLGRSIRTELIVASIILFILTIAYETVRTMKKGWLTICLSGLGFPLRFTVGALAASQISVWNCPLYDKILIFMAFWLWGMMVSIMTWVREVDDLIFKKKIGKDNQSTKAHYNIIYSFIWNRRVNLEDNESVFFKKGSLSDIWTICFLLTLIVMIIHRLLHVRVIFLIGAPLVSVIFAALIFLKNQRSRFVNCLGCLTAIIIDVYGAWLFNDNFKGIYLYNILLILIIISVCILKRESRGKYVKYNIFQRIVKFTIGEEAFNELSEANDR